MTNIGWTIHLQTHQKRRLFFKSRSGWSFVTAAVENESTLSESSKSHTHFLQSKKKKKKKHSVFGVPDNGVQVEDASSESDSSASSGKQDSPPWPQNTLSLHVTCGVTKQRWNNGHGHLAVLRRPGPTSEDWPVRRDQLFKLLFPSYAGPSTQNSDFSS